MICVTLAMFLAALGATTVATALPSIVADLGQSPIASDSRSRRECLIP